MITKMRGVLDPSLKYEVDYEEAVKDVSNALFMWRMEAAAGKRAFIPDIADRDLCFAAVKIFSHALEEAKVIPEEFCEEFGRFGIPVYNDLVGIIGERDKNCIPFVNMCLRSWMQSLVLILTFLFNFDKWVEEKLAEPLSNHHGGKTSYELMMTVFVNAEENNNSPPTKIAQTSSAKATITTTTTSRSMTSFTTTSLYPDKQVTKGWQKS